jgi:hypothetical protein
MAPRGLENAHRSPCPVGRDSRTTCFPHQVHTHSRLGKLMLCIECNVDQEGLHDVRVSPCLGWSSWVAIDPSYVRHGDSIARRGHEGRALVSGEPNLDAANTRERGPRVRWGRSGANEKIKSIHE